MSRQVDVLSCRCLSLDLHYFIYITRMIIIIIIIVCCCYFSIGKEHKCRHSFRLILYVCIFYVHT